MKKRVKQLLAWLSAALEVCYVPLAAAIVGWVSGAGFSLAILDRLNFEPAARQALAESPVFMYGTQTALAVLLFYIAWRYLA